MRIKIALVVVIALATLAKAEEESLEQTTVKAKAGDVAAQNTLARIYFFGKGVPTNHVEALKWLRMSAEQGDAQAQFEIGKMYYSGIGVTKDYGAALKWFAKAAGQNHDDAQYSLGVMYDEGSGVKKDKSEAVRWYRQSADQGDAEAQNNLGSMYYNGEGVAKDYGEALKLYRKAAEQGNEHSQHNLAVMYVNGEGVSKDYVIAYMWWSVANVGGADTKAEIRNISKLMTRQQIAEAKKLAREFKPIKARNANVDWKNPVAIEMTAAGDFLLGLNEQGLIPGVSKDAHGSLSSETRPNPLPDKAAYPFTQTFHLTINGETYTNNYTVVHGSKDSAWRLERAWRTDTDGKILEEWPIK